jgi:fatty acid synthase subunit alpha, fungi type
MATRTLKAKYEPRDDSINHPRSILCHTKNAKEIYYQFEDETEAPSPAESAPEEGCMGPLRKGDLMECN